MWHSFIRKSTRAGLHAADRPDLLLVFDLVSTETQAASSALCFLPLSGLAAEPERNALEVLLHAPLWAGRQRASGVGARHVLIEDLGLFLDDVEDGQEGCFRGELDGDDHVAHGSEDGRHDGRQVGTHDVVVLAGNGADHDE